MERNTARARAFSDSPGGLVVHVPQRDSLKEQTEADQDPETQVSLKYPVPAKTSTP